MTERSTQNHGDCYGFSLLAGIGLGAGYMSIIGPIKIGLMYGDYKKEAYFNKIKGYISIGYNF